MLTERTSTISTRMGWFSVLLQHFSEALGANSRQSIKSGFASAAERFGIIAPAFGVH